MALSLKAAVVEAQGTVLGAVLSLLLLCRAVPVGWLSLLQNTFHQIPSKEAWAVQQQCEEDKWLQWWGTGGVRLQNAKCKLIMACPH